MAKKLISIILCLVLCFAILPFSASADNIEGYNYYVGEDGTAAIVGYRGEGTVLYIPGMIDGHTVTRIERYAFQNNSKVTGIHLPNSVTSIGEAAFYNCAALESVTLSDHITNILFGTFYGCTSLTNVALPYYLTNIGRYAFYGCIGLESITLPDYVTSIEEYAFYGCSGLTSINLPNTVASIGDFTFYDCSSLAGVTIPSSVTSISECTFDGCSGLESVTIPDSVVTIGSQAFYRCASLKSVVIPDSVTSIERFAFSGCTSLTNAVISASVTCIPVCAFSECTGLTGITIPDSVTTISNCAFSSCTGLKNIIIPDSVTTIAEDAFSDTEWFNDQPDGLVYAGKVLYKLKGSCPESAVVKEGTVGISPKAFEGCTDLTDVMIPDSVVFIGENAFYDTAWYDNQPDGLVYAGKVLYSAKGNCSSFVTLKDDTVSISPMAFLGHLELTGVIIPDSVRSIGEKAFYYCLELESVSTGNGVISIGEESFSCCAQLTSVTFGKSVKSIGDNAFAFCINLESIDLPDSLETIGLGAFVSCDNLKSLKIPDSVISIGTLMYAYHYGSGRVNKIDGCTIYGYSGSVAEYYANINDISFVSLGQSHNKKKVILTDMYSRITVETDVQDAELTVEELEPNEITVAVDGSIIAAYDITLLKDSAVIQPDGTVTVKIPCSDPDAVVYRVNADNSLELIESSYSGGYLIFTTDHFSVYLVVSPVQALLGDADGNGVVNVFDASYVQKGLTGTAGYPDYSTMDKSDIAYRAADVDGNGIVNIFDAATIQKFLTGSASAQGLGIGEPLS